MDSHTGIPLNKESFYNIERIISDGVQKGQHIYHIVKSNSLPISIATIMQLDTVIGRPGGKINMTIHFINSDFTTGLLLDNKTAAEAVIKFQNLKTSLKASGFCFGNIAPLLLTDNGSEFSMVSAYENDIDGDIESRLFLCEPYSPYEKADIEKNHTILRDIGKKEHLLTTLIESEYRTV